MGTTKLSNNFENIKATMDSIRYIIEQFKEMNKLFDRVSDGMKDATETMDAFLGKTKSIKDDSHLAIASNTATVTLMKDRDLVIYRQGKSVRIPTPSYFRDDIVSLLNTLEGDYPSGRL